MSELVTQYRQLVFDQPRMLSSLVTAALILVAFGSLCVQWLLRGYVPDRWEHTSDESRDVRFAVFGATVTLIWQLILAGICVVHLLAEYDSAQTIRKGMIVLATSDAGCTIFGLQSWARLLRESRRRNRH